MIEGIYSGDPQSPVWIVGEAPGEKEIEHGLPFVGASGQELTRMLAEAGISRSSCFLTNVVSQRPPGNDISLFYHKNKTEARAAGAEPLLGRYPKEHLRLGALTLRRNVQEYHPRLVIAVGDTSLWALTGKSGITSWRGSVIDPSPLPTKVLPTFHPAAILRMWDWRAIAVQDLRRAAREAQFEGIRRDPWRFTLRPSFGEVREFLNDLLRNPRHFAVDGEMFNRQISCLGLATSKLDAICIPFHCQDGDRGYSYWGPEEERQIILRLKQVLEGLKWSIYHNGAWDLMYQAASWGFQPQIRDDTMLMQHVAFPGMGAVPKLAKLVGVADDEGFGKQKGGGKLKAKSLYFVASLYCENYCYWKDDGKLWDPRIHTEEQKWKYNCEDCVRTYESREVLSGVLEDRGLTKQYRWQMDKLFPIANEVMLRGIKTDLASKKKLANDLTLKKRNIEDWFVTVLNHPLNPDSSVQMKNLFFEDFRVAKQYNRKTKALSLDEEALEKIMKAQPLLEPLIRKIANWRSLKVFKSTFVDSPVSPDGRMRCLVNMTGAETMRWSTGIDMFDEGMNMQNLPKDKPSKHKINQDQWDLPNIRDLFLADEGMTLFEADLSGADAQIVAWEANDENMKAIFREGRSLWTEGAREMYGPNFTHTHRQIVKQCGHATDYVCKAPTLAKYIGTTVHEAEEWQRRWLGMFPGVERWQRETDRELQLTRQVTNVYGYKRYYFGRIETLLPEALAWKAQSAVALTINHGMVQLRETFPRKLVQILLQVHDSCLGQFPTEQHATLLHPIRQAFLVPIPFEDPLTIPIDIQVSEERWGSVEKVSLNAKAA